MENENTKYSFLNSDEAKKCFADVDVALKQGRHIQNYGNDTQLFGFVDDYYSDGLADYYKDFWGVNFVQGSSDNEKFYYLDFSEGSKGKFGKENRYKELEDKKVIFAILLLNLYKEKFFEEKQVEWKELEQIFKESENKSLWKKLLFGKDKENYTPNEEQKIKDDITSIVKDFEKLGWVFVFPDTENLKFEVLPSIERISRLYADVIENVESIEKYLSNE
jgi:hypothetical protein